MSGPIPLELQTAPFKGKVIYTESCWLFTGGLSSCGHGMISRKTHGETYAHRLAYKRLVGIIPTGLLVLHTCSNADCINPAHLYLGTQQDNMRDRAKAETGFNTTLTADAVREIRSSKEKASALAIHYKVSNHQINRILRRNQWSHVA